MTTSPARLPQQWQGIEQVGQTITQMDQSTLQNAALVEETTAARRMEEQAHQLRAAVSVIRLQASSTPARLGRAA
ncbi:hypothetical protein ACDH50_03450 [Xanthomonas fragariae]